MEKQEQTDLVRWMPRTKLLSDRKGYRYLSEYLEKRWKDPGETSFKNLHKAKTHAAGYRIYLYKARQNI